MGDESALLAERVRQLEQEVRRLREREQALEERALAAQCDTDALLETMEEGFVAYDSQLRYTRVNVAAETIVGKRRKELLGRCYLDVFPEAKGSEFDLALRRVLEDRAPAELCLFFEPWKRWFRIQLHAWRDGVACCFREITDEMRQRKALEESRRQLELISSNIPVMVWTARPDGFHEYFNKRWCEYTGMTLEQTQGWGWSHLLHPEDRERCIERWMQSLETGEPYSIEYRFRRASDGAYRWFLGQAQPLRDDRGSIVRWFGICADIDDQKRAEAELASARAAAEEANRAKSDFLASMSHELRTPLNAIIGYSEMLQEDVVEAGMPQLSTDLARILSAGKHLLALVSDILDLSRIEAGRMDIVVENFEPADLIQEILPVARSLAGRHGNTLIADVQRGVAPMTSDRVRIRQNLLNLLSNASRVTRDGAIRLAVSDGPNGDVCFTVADTGPGIGAESLRVLFEPFSQVHHKADGSGGAGVGLAIVRRFTEMMGGTVSVKSAPGQGAAFTMRLPRVLPPELRPQIAAPAEPTAMPGRRGVALIIDDDASARDILERNLRREGFYTVSASSGEEGLRLARSVRPGLITLDVVMPGMDGWSVLQQLKEDPELAAVPVVMVSMTTDRSRAFALGASEFIVKPATRDKLSAAVAKFRCSPGQCSVLVLDDDEASRELTTAMLRRDGWQVDAAANGLDGLEVLRQHRPDVVVLDLLMPAMDGFEFLSRLRSTPGCADLPVVVLTAASLSAEERERLCGRVDKILLKGALPADQVVGEIRSLLR